MTSPTYILTRWPRGWTLSGIHGQKGIPLTALAEASKLLGKKTVLDAGICSHLNRTSHPGVVVVLGTLPHLQKWRAEITASLAHARSPEEAWWIGLDTGLSAAAIFSVLAEDPDLRAEAAAWSSGRTPADAADLGRCLRLLALFPGWTARLPEVAAAYPGIRRWPRLVPLWPQLTAAHAAGDTAEIHRLLTTH
jgi:hypothetical protein